MTGERTRERILGVLGGMGPAATLDFLSKLQGATPAAGDQDHLRVLVDINPKVPDRNAALSARGPSPGPALAAMARGLEQAGAEGVVMVCNSAHAFVGEVRAALSHAVLIDLIDATVAEVRRTYPAVRRVGLLAASACLDARLYQDRFAGAGVEALGPQGGAQDRFMALLYRIKAGDRDAGARAEMAAIAATLVDQGAEMIVSACTEVSLVLTPADLERPLVDSTDVLVAAALAFARGG